MDKRFAFYAACSLVACLFTLVGCQSGTPDAAETPAQEPTINDVMPQQAQNAPEADEKSPAKAIENETRTLLENMTLEEKVAQLFVITPEALTGTEAVITADETTYAALEQHPVGGLIYFGQNLQDADQTRDMLAATQSYAQEINGVPLLLCVDEEGGTVSRVGGAPGFDIENVGNMASVETPEEAGNVASTIATYLTDLGFNVDFAPDADLANVEGSTLALRSFGATPEEASPLVQAQVESFLDGGVLCAAKHFPGIGGALGDSHNESIYSTETLEEMAAEEFLPFQAAIAADVPFIMVGHLTCEAATGSTLPASLNQVVIRDALRSQLGYQGIIITDSLSMAAATEVTSADRVGVDLLNAGGDMILMPLDFAAAYQGVLDAVASGEIPETRIDESVERVLTAKLTYLS